MLARIFGHNTRHKMRSLSFLWMLSISKYHTYPKGVIFFEFCDCVFHAQYISKVCPRGFPLLKQTFATPISSRNVSSVEREPSPKCRSSTHTHTHAKRKGFFFGKSNMAMDNTLEISRKLGLNKQKSTIKWQISPVPCYHVGLPDGLFGWHPQPHDFKHSGPKLTWGPVGLWIFGRTLKPVINEHTCLKVSNNYMWLQCTLYFSIWVASLKSSPKVKIHTHFQGSKTAFSFGSAWPWFDA